MANNPFDNLSIRLDEWFYEAELYNVLQLGTTMNLPLMK